MKKLLVGLLTLSSVSVFADEKIVSRKMVIFEDIKSVSGCDKVIRSDYHTALATLKIVSIQDYKVYLVKQTIKNGVVKKEKLLNVEETVRGKNVVTTEQFKSDLDYHEGSYNGTAKSQCRAKAKKLGFDL